MHAVSIPIRRTSQIAAVAVALLFLAAAPAGAQQRVRRNIDDLTPQQLADYVHAVAKLKAISQQDPSSKDGYIYLAELHDDSFVGPCEHGSDTFLPWHRAHLLEFEDALRRSDPPRTANVTVPYWDWSELPSGKRYPLAFEDPQSVLYDGQRETTPICRPSGGGGDCEPLSFPRSYLDKEVLSAPGWLGTGSRFFGGKSDGALECRRRRRTGYGALESPAHNDMHGSYVGGLMRSAATAAEDPIFWSFHSYIDLLLDQWQAAEHAIDSCLTCKLCGLVKPDGTPWTVRDTLSTSALGYRYQYGPTVAPPVVAAAAVGDEPLFEPLPAAGMALSGKLPVEVLRTRELVVPETVGDRVELRLAGVPRTTAFSYNGDVYLYPQDADFLPRDDEFRRRHMVDLFSVFAGHAGHEHGEGEDGDAGEIEVVLDLTDELRALARRHAGETWHLTVALVANTLGEESRLEFAAAALGDDASFAEAMSFDEMTLEGLP